MSDEHNKLTLTEPDKLTRDNLGRFVAGVSGNPKGRPKGAKNRLTLVREAIAESLTNDLAGDVHEILDKAKKMALKGDQQMIKLLLKDFILAPKEDEDEKGKGPGKIQISIKNLTVKPDAPVEKAVSDALEGEYSTSEE